MHSLKKSFTVIKGDFIHGGEASISVKNLLKSLRFDIELVRRVSICGYEAEMNIVMHGGNGLFCVRIDERVITLDISDDGPGIADTEKAMEVGFSTAKDEYREMGFGAGMGLPNMKKNSDSILIDSAPGKGTRLEMAFYVNGRGETNGLP